MKPAIVSASQNTSGRIGEEEMKRRMLGGALIAVAIAGGAVVVTAGPASASQGQCASGKYCVWNNSAYGGVFKSYTSTSGNMGIGNDNVTNMNDIASAQYNRTGGSVKVWEDVSNAGRHNSYADGSAFSNLSDSTAGLPFPLTWNDRISSFTI